MNLKKKLATKAEGHYLFYEGLIQKEECEKRRQEYQDAANFWLEEYLRNCNDEDLWDELGLILRE